MFDQEALEKNVPQGRQDGEVGADTGALSLPLILGELADELRLRRVLLKRRDSLACAEAIYSHLRLPT